MSEKRVEWAKGVESRKWDGEVGVQEDKRESEG